MAAILTYVYVKLPSCFENSSTGFNTVSMLLFYLQIPVVSEKIGNNKLLKNADAN